MNFILESQNNRNDDFKTYLQKLRDFDSIELNEN